MKSRELKRLIVAGCAAGLWSVMSVWPSASLAQSAHDNIMASAKKFDQRNDAASDETIESLIQSRIDKEWKTFGPHSQPELVKTEANYVRVGVASNDVLYEASFHLHPSYYNHSPAAPEMTHNVDPGQSVMYFVGSARTPLALPVVSNLSKALSGDEASYTINLGVLPLPYPGHPDSMRYYVVIERAIESNHTDNIIRFERFQKDFTAKADEPVPLRLADELPAKGAYILQLESGQVLDFYDDFARFISEHILINSERLKFNLGKQTISDVSSRLSIPYSVARNCNVKVQLISVVNTADTATIVDTMRPPADYLAEYDMSHFSDGPYRYRFVAQDLATGKTIFDTTADFHKMTPLTVGMSNRIIPGDTLKVGGKKRDWAAEMAQLNDQLAREQVVNDRISSTLTKDEREKRALEDILKANQHTSIADIHLRAGFGIGAVAGDNLFVGIESNKPSLALDVSFGFLYGGLHQYLTGWQAPTGQNISNIGSSPKSLGLTMTWIPAKVFDGWIEPLTDLSFYGTWATPNASGITTASVISGGIGVATEPSGEVHGIGFSLAYNVMTGLGLGQGLLSDLSARMYVRF